MFEHEIQIGSTVGISSENRLRTIVSWILHDSRVDEVTSILRFQHGDVFDVGSPKGDEIITEPFRPEENNFDLSASIRWELPDLFDYKLHETAMKIPNFHLTLSRTF